MARNRSNTSVVCDAGPIIHLDEIGLLYLMKDFEEVLIPDAVRREVMKHRTIVFEGSDVRWRVITRRFPMEESLGTMCRVFSLDAGETESLAILGKMPDFVFLTDDTAARPVAERLGFRVHGTIGVLVRTIRRNLMKPNEVIDALKRIPSESSLHIKSSLLKEVLSRLKEEFNL